MTAHLASAPDSAAVVEHAYGRSTPFSLGVEEEFQLVDPAGYDLANVAGPLLDAATETDLERITPELMQSVIECTTSVCGTTAAAADELLRLRRRVAELARETSGSLIASAGTHPFARYDDQLITDKERYRTLVNGLKWIAERELIFGLHVHVGMQSTDQAMYVFNGIRRYLPELLALSANSPFWQGRRTGLASSRSKVFDAFPRSGVPQSFATWDEYEALIGRAMAVGAIKDYSYVWWDVRPHPRFGTIEVRVCDAQTRLSDTLALSALVQATAAWLGEAFDEGRPLDLVPTFLINENKWSAARHGLDGEFIDFGRDERITARSAISKLIETVEPYAQRLGASAEFAMLDSLLVQNGASRQLAVHDETGDLSAVGAMLARETAV